MADKGKCPEAPEPQGPNGGYQSRRRLYDSLTDIVTDWRETYVRPLCQPLRTRSRLLYSWAGSFTVIIAAPIALTGLAFPSTEDEKSVSGSRILFEFIQLGGTLNLFVIAVLLSGFYAHLIAAAKTRHGPLRLYLSGLLVPVVTISIIRYAWSS